MSDWTFILAEQVVETSFVYWVIILLGACQVLLARSNHIWLYPFGVVGMSLALLSLSGSARYVDLAFGVYFLVMYLDGWIRWTKRDKLGSFYISYAQGNDWRMVSFMTAGSFIGLYLLSMMTGSASPIWQAAIGAAMCAGIWLLNNRKIEYWVMLNISQALAIPLLLYNGQFLYGILAFLLYAFSFSGFFTWRRIIHQQSGFLQL